MDRRDFLRSSLVVLGTPLLTNLSTASEALAKHRVTRPTVDGKLPRDGTDVTGQLLDIIAAAPDGTRFLIPAGRYRMEGSCLVTGRNELLFVGDGQAVFYATAPGALDPQGHSQRRHFWFQDCTAISLRNIRVESTNTVEDPDRPGFALYDSSHEFEHAFCFVGCTTVRVKSCEAYGTWGDGLYAGGLLTSDLAVRNFTVSWNGRHGVGLTYVDGVLLDNVNLANSRYAGVDMEPNATPGFVRNVEIRNSSLHTWLIAFAAGGVNDVSDISIHDNSISRSSVPWLICSPSSSVRRQNWTVADNTFAYPQSSTSTAPLVFARTDGVRVTGNRSPVSDRTSSCGRAVHFADCGYSATIPELSVADNDFSPGGKIIAVSQSATVEATANRPTDLQVIVS